MQAVPAHEWLTVVRTTAQSLGHQLPDDGYIALTTILHPYIERARAADAETVARITTNYLRDHELVAGLQAPVDSPAHEQANEQVWGWIVALTNKGGQAQREDIVAASIDINAWNDLRSNLHQYNYEARLTQYVARIFQNRWRLHYRSQTSLRRGGLGIEATRALAGTTTFGTLARDRTVPFDTMLEDTMRYTDDTRRAPEDTMLRRHDIGLVDQGIAALCRRHRSEQPRYIMAAYHGWGLTLREIGEQLGLSTNQVWRTIKRHHTEIEGWLLAHGFSVA